MGNQASAVSIEKVTAETFEALITLIEKLAAYENLPPPNQDAKMRLRKDYLSERPKYEAYIAKCGDTYIGYFTYFYTYSTFLAQPTLYLEDIFVLQEFRRRGVGEEIFGFIKQVAKREGCGRIEFTVLKWNKTAQQFYRKIGAKQLEWDIYRIQREDF
jgi:GNAT superfamily N-acetyltransferase